MSSATVTWHVITCDEPDCPEVSPARSSRLAAEEQADADGWLLSVDSNGPDHCPNHRK